MQNTLCHHLLVLLHCLCPLPNNSESSLCWDMVVHFVSVTLHHMLGSVFVLADIYCKNMMVILTQNIVTSVACVVTPSC